VGVYECVYVCASVFRPRCNFHTIKSGTQTHTHTHAHTLTHTHTHTHCKKLTPTDVKCHRIFGALQYFPVFQKYKIVCDVATHCTTLHHTAHTTMHHNTLRCTATHCNPLQHTATHCNTLQHTAMHCNTLQPAATHCNTLQHAAARESNTREPRDCCCPAVFLRFSEM